MDKINIKIDNKEYKTIDDFIFTFFDKSSDSILEDAVIWYTKGDYNTTQSYYTDCEESIVRNEGERVFWDRRNRTMNKRYSLRENIIYEAYKNYITESIRKEYNTMIAEMNRDKLNTLTKDVEGYEFQLSRKNIKKYRITSVPEYYMWTKDGGEDEGYFCDEFGYSLADCLPKTLEEIRIEILDIIDRVFGEGSNAADEILNPRNWWFDNDLYIFDGDIDFESGDALNTICFTAKEESNNE